MAESVSVSKLNQATYLEDRLFASSLVSHGVLSKEHVDDILEARAAMYEGSNLLPLRYELVETGIIDQAAAELAMEPLEGFLKAKKRKGMFVRPLFGEAAVKLKKLTYDQLEELLEKQLLLKKTGRKGQQIGQLALGLNMLSDPDIALIVEAQDFAVVRWAKQFMRFSAQNKSVVRVGVPVLLSALVILFFYSVYFQRSYFQELGAYLDRVESMSYDVRFRIRDGMSPIDPYQPIEKATLWSEKRMPPADVIIVDVDQRTMQRFNNRWPFSRAEMGILVDRLAQGGVKSVGWDVLFTSPDNPDELELMKKLVEKFQSMHGISEKSEPEENSSPSDPGDSLDDFGFGEDDSKDEETTPAAKDGAADDEDFDNFFDESDEKAGDDQKEETEKENTTDAAADDDGFAAAFGEDTATDKAEEDSSQSADSKNDSSVSSADDKDGFGAVFGESETKPAADGADESFDFPDENESEATAVTDPNHPAFYPVLMNAYQDMLHDKAFADAITRGYDNHNLRNVAAMYFIDEEFRETAKSQADLDAELFGRSAFLSRIPLHPRTFDVIPKEKGGEELLLQDVNTLIPSMVGVLGTIKPISDAVESQGFVNAIVDADGVLRGMWTAIPFKLNPNSPGIEFYPSMAFQTASYFLEREGQIADPSVGWTWEYKGAKIGAYARDTAIGDYKLDLASNGRLLLNYYGEGNWKEFFEVTLCGEVERPGTIEFKEASDELSPEFQGFLKKAGVKRQARGIARVVKSISKPRSETAANGDASSNSLHIPNNNPEIEVEKLISFNSMSASDWSRSLEGLRKRIENIEKSENQDASAATQLDALKAEYDMFRNLLSPGNVLFFPPTQPKSTFQIVGVVHKPGDYDTSTDGISLKAAIEMAGGLTPMGIVDVRRSCLIRKPAGQDDYSFLPIYLDGHLNLDLRVLAGDTVVLPRPYHRGRIFKYYSFVDIYDRKINLDELKGKAVMVGSTSRELGDFLTSPHGEFPGLEIQATYCQNIIHNNPIRKRNLKGFNVTLLVVCTLAIGLLVGLLPQLWAISGFFICITGYAIFVYIYFAHGRTWIDLTGPMMGMCSIFGAVSLFRFFTEQREKKKVQGMFSTMVSPEVLDYMQENPDRFRLTGERRNATMFFSDVAGFTTISETLSPEALAMVLNRYLTPMSDIILSYGGYIDKYEGDAIMADFGVPIWTDEDPDSHAWKCCWAALDQGAKLLEISQELRDEFGVDIDARMGINSGAVVAGNMGSSQKFQYTVMGDAVNQAARFEPANKPFDTHIMIGQSTKEMSEGKIETRFMAAMIVKGKTEPVLTYELVGKKGEVPPERMKLYEIFENGWKLHSEQKWDEAIAEFDKALEMDPDDGPSRVYREICEEYKLEPPKEGWKGEWIQTSK